MTAAVPSPRASRKLVREFRGRRGNGVDTTAGRATPSLGRRRIATVHATGPRSPPPAGRRTGCRTSLPESARHNWSRSSSGRLLVARGRHAAVPHDHRVHGPLSASMLRRKPLHPLAGTRRLGVQFGQARIIMEQVIRRSPAAQNDPMPTGLCELMTSAARTAFSNRLPDLPKRSIATRVERPIDELGFGRERSRMRTLRK